MKLTICFTLLFSVFSHAADLTKLECQTKLNLDVESTSVVVTGLKIKSLINDGNEAKSYVTEVSPGVFSIETYLYEQDMKVYSQGSLDSELTLSTWARKSMLDISCKKLN